MENDIKILVGIGVGTLLLVVGGIFLLTKQSSKPQVVKRIPMQELVKSTSHKSSEIPTPVNIVEFGDFQCPACGQTYPNIEKILADYSGKVTLYFRNFPLTQHKNAKIAAEAAESANEEGKFWLMYKELYTNQTKWSDLEKPMDEFLKYADEIKLDKDKFKKNVEDNKFAKVIDSDQSDGISLGVNATPTLYIDGIKFEGAPTYENLKKIIDSELLSATTLPVASSSASATPSASPKTK